MGLFSFIGKAVKAVTHSIPFVGTALDIASGVGSLLSHKNTTGTKTSPKINMLAKLGTQIARAKAPAPSYTPQVYRMGNTTQGMPVPRQVFSSTPTMPGGGVATPSGIVAASSPTPPASFSGSGAAPRAKRKTRSRTRPPSRKKKASGRKLKFGSPAWRKKYLKKKRRS